jgi:hypothetical protein
MERMVQRAIPEIDWHGLFGASYAQAEQQALRCRAYADTDITAWVNAMEVFDDLLLVALFARDGSIGGPYNGGKVGGIVGCAALKAKYPAIQRLVEEIHERRKDSDLSHPWARRVGKPPKPTRRIRYSYIRRGRQLLRAALAELSSLW